MSIIEAIQDPHLFKPLFKDLATWASWQTFLKALFGLPMSEQDLILYRDCTGRVAPPTAPFQEAWAPTGRRSGKSFIAALTAVFLACFKDYTPHLATGERAMILVIAADRQQAGIIFRYIRGFLSANKMMSKLVEVEKAESIDLSNRVTIMVGTSSYRSIRGFTAAAVIAHGIGFWRSDSDSANPAHEVLGGTAFPGTDPGFPAALHKLTLAGQAPCMRHSTGTMAGMIVTYWSGRPTPPR